MAQTRRVGWIQILLGLILLGLAVRYWWITVPVLLVGTAVVLWRRAQTKARTRERMENERQASEKAERLAREAHEQRQARRLALLEAGVKTKKASASEEAPFRLNTEEHSHGKNK
jgi:Flp pilus assembly protein TadB